MVWSGQRKVSHKARRQDKGIVSGDTWHKGDFYYGPSMRLAAGNKLKKKKSLAFQKGKTQMNYLLFILSGSTEAKHLT